MASKRRLGRQQYTKEELILMAKGTNNAINMKVQMLLTIGILLDDFGFTKEDIEDFVDAYKFHLDSYNAGNENMKLWAATIKERTGIEIEV